MLIFLTFSQFTTFSKFSKKLSRINVIVQFMKGYVEIDWQATAHWELRSYRYVRTKDQPTVPVYSTGNVMTLQFKSDFFFTNRGFLASFSSTQTGVYYLLPKSVILFFWTVFIIVNIAYTHWNRSISHRNEQLIWQNTFAIKLCNYFYRYWPLCRYSLQDTPLL